MAFPESPFGKDLLRAYRGAAGAEEYEVGQLSVWISLVLLAVYAANLVFSLITHPALFAGSHEEEDRSTPPPGAPGTPRVCSAPPLPRSPG